MAIFYDDGVRNTSAQPFDYWKFNANSSWANHRYNEIILKHIANKSDNFNERAQAIKELTVCERKIKYANNHPNFDMSLAEKFLRSQYGIKVDEFAVDTVG